MMKKSLSILLVTFALILSAGVAPSRKTYLHWEDHYKLQWSDFRGSAEQTAFGDAASTIHLSADPVRKKGKITYDVRAWFIPEQSWCRKKSENLLEHEQLHFDLAELYARKVRKRIDELNRMGLKDRKEYHRNITRIFEESTTADRKYDRETLHGSRSAKQKEWEKYVQDELFRYRHFRQSVQEL